MLCGGVKTPPQWGVKTPWWGGVKTHCWGGVKTGRLTLALVGFPWEIMILAGVKTCGWGVSKHPWVRVSKHAFGGVSKHGL